jgi:hypothetical protein
MYLNRVVENLRKFGREESGQGAREKVLLIGGLIAATTVVLFGPQNYAKPVDANTTFDHGVPRHHYTKPAMEDLMR